MIEKHINKLIKIGDDNQGYLGNNSLKWAQFVIENNTIIDKNLDTRFDRYQLFKYCDNKNIDNLNVLTAILSWGGMRRDHGKRLFNNLNNLLPLIDNLRKGIYKSRKEAFDAFQKQRINGLLPGLGIGYFTKLICFLSPGLKGYIMDQWVGKSINLITGEVITKLTSNSWVNDKNNSTDYEIFCSKIDKLAIRLNCEGIEAEKRIFSVGHGKGQWRKYLIENYNHN
jgi:hypothetical protein